LKLSPELQKKTLDI